jgi:hypothetical protein
MKVLPQHHNHNHKSHICGVVIPHHTTNDYTFVVLWYNMSYKVVNQVCGNQNEGKMEAVEKSRFEIHPAVEYAKKYAHSKMAKTGVI